MRTCHRMTCCDSRGRLRWPELSPSADSELKVRHKRGLAKVIWALEVLPVHRHLLELCSSCLELDPFVRCTALEASESAFVVEHVDPAAVDLDPEPIVCDDEYSRSSSTSSL